MTFLKLPCLCSLHGMGYILVPSTHSIPLTPTYMHVHHNKLDKIDGDLYLKTTNSINKCLNVTGLML